MSHKDSTREQNIMKRLWLPHMRKRLRLQPHYLNVKVLTKTATFKACINCSNSQNLT